MNHCPACGMPLKDGLEFCPPTKTMTDGAWGGNPTETRGVYAFAGCRELCFENLIKDTVMRRGPSAGRAPKGLTDYQRAEKAYGKDCILSEFGPLPTEKEIRESPVPYDEEWGQIVEQGGNSRGSEGVPSFGPTIRMDAGSPGVRIVKR